MNNSGAENLQYALTARKSLKFRTEVHTVARKLIITTELILFTYINNLILNGNITKLFV